MAGAPSAPGQQWRRLKSNARFLYWRRVTRRSQRLMRRVLAVIALSLVLFGVWNYRQPDERRVVRRETISREHMMSSLQHRLGHHTQDLRTWNGWPGIKTIFAL